MQTCFFAISGVLPRGRGASPPSSMSIEKTYGKRGEAVVRKNWAAVDSALEHLAEVTVPGRTTSALGIRPPVPVDAPEFVQRVTATDDRGEGDSLPVSALPSDGTYPTGTAQWEKRNIALEIPAWDEALCIQCGKCVLVCPHAVIRAKVYAPTVAGRRAVRVQVGAGALARVRRRPLHAVRSRRRTARAARSASRCARPRARARYATRPSTWRRCAAPRSGGGELEVLPGAARSGPPRAQRGQIEGRPAPEPLFEFSGACAGCGETPYLKLLSQLFGDRAVIANATGCSSHLRRQSADHAMDDQSRRTGDRPGPTRSSRTTPSSVSACGSPRQAGGDTRASWSTRLGPALGEPRGRRCSAPINPRRRGSKPSGAGSRELKERCVGSTSPARRELRVSGAMLW